MTTFMPHWGNGTAVHTVPISLLWSWNRLKKHNCYGQKCSWWLYQPLISTVVVRIMNVKCRIGESYLHPPHPPPPGHSGGMFPSIKNASHTSQRHTRPRVPVTTENISLLPLKFLKQVGSQKPPPSPSPLYNNLHLNNESIFFLTQGFQIIQVMC